MTQVGEFDVQVHQLEQYRFRIDFDKPGHAPLFMDEPAPLGKDSAPNAARVLAAAIGNCLSASLMFCMKKSGHEPKHIDATVHVELARNDERRLRIGAVRVELAPEVDAEEREALEKCLGAFEDFCVVTQSVRAGIDVQVSVTPREAS
jgi:organic hydroperoxide reductase OsmC/OhrA